MYDNIKYNCYIYYLIINKMLEHSYAFDFRKEKKNEYKNRNISEDKFS
jgi:hypothetical protein